MDAYLCGEVHAITCTERDGIMQIAHGGLIGYNVRTNYMVVNVYRDSVQFELKEIEMLPHGDHLWQTKDNRPLQNVSITDENRKKGFYTVGLATLDKSNGKRFIDRKGFFLKEHQFSEDIAQPIFKKDNKYGLPIELPKITVEE